MPTDLFQISKIGEKIKQFRTAQGLTQQEFADELGITRELLSQMERGAKNISSATALLLGNVFNENNVPSDFFLDYQTGQRLANVLAILKENGENMGKLRIEDLKIKSNQLNCIFLGLCPIPENIKQLLKDQFHVNLRYINSGEYPIFFKKYKSFNESNLMLNESLTMLKKQTLYSAIPYFDGMDVSKSLQQLQSAHEIATSNILLPFGDISGYLNYLGDSMEPKINNGAIIGIKAMQIDLIRFGQIYLIQLKNEDIILGYIHKADASGLWKMSSENKKYPDAIIETNEVRSLYLVKCAINLLTA